jgi:phospholipid/cholesterol/gamma-HCH transport system substrate-binding protein
MGLLGDKYVELSSGSPDAELIKSGDMIKGTAVVELKDVAEISASSIKQMSDFINKLDRLVTKIERGEGTFAKFLTDPEIYVTLKDISKTLSVVLHEIKDGQGTFKMLLYDPSLYNRMLAATASVEEFTLVLNDRQGTLRRLAEDPALYENLNRASQQLSSIMEKIDSGNGVASDLITNEKLASDLKDTITDIKELTKDMRDNPKKYFKFSLF